MHFAYIMLKEEVLDRMLLGPPETSSSLSSPGLTAHMGYLQSSLIHPPYGEQKLGMLVALFRPSVPYHTSVLFLFSKLSVTLSKLGEGGNEGFASPLSLSILSQFQ